MSDRERRDRRKALLWHRTEMGFVLALLAFVTVGWLWSESHNRSRLVETRPR